MNPRCIKPGESLDTAIRLPDGVSLEDVMSGKVKMEVGLTAFCDCGEQLVRVMPSVWGCPNDRWYLRLFRLGRGHARLGVTQQLVSIGREPLGPNTKVGAAR